MIKHVALDGVDQIINVSESDQIVLDFPIVTSSKRLDVNLIKEGAQAEILGVYVGNGDQKIDLIINAIHKVPNTICLTQIRGVLKDSSQSTFKGMIKIEKNAQKTNSYLDDDVLILGKDAKNQSEPTLEIEADDVKATHGATTGRISDEHLFYLQSRGLTKEESEKMIIEGFLEPVIAKINDEDFKKELALKVKESL